MDPQLLEHLRDLDCVPFQELVKGMAVSVGQAIEKAAQYDLKPPLSRNEAALPRSYYTSMAEEIKDELIKVMQDIQGVSIQLRGALSTTQPPLRVRGVDVNPLAGLSDVAVRLIKMVLEALCHSMVPQLLKLGCKALREAQIWRRAAVYTSHKAERQSVDTAILVLQGLAPRYEDLGEDGTKLEKVLGAGVGRAFAIAITDDIHKILQALLTLCIACLDVPQQIIIARANKQPTSITRTSSPADARKHALDSSSVLIDTAINIAQNVVSNDKVAVARNWMDRQFEMDAAWSEMHELVGNEASSTSATRRTGTVSAKSRQLAVALTREERARAKRFLPLIDLGHQLHRAIGRTLPKAGNLLLLSRARREHAQSAFCRSSIWVISCIAQSDALSALLTRPKQHGFSTWT